MCSNAVPDRDVVMAVVERFRAVMAELVELGLDALDVPDLFADSRFIRLMSQSA
jgi:hypothetical protein